MRERWGADALVRVAARVPEGARKYLIEAPPLTFAWYSFGVMMDVDRQIIDGPMGGEIGRMKELGSAIAKHDLPLFYRVLFKVGSPAFIVRRLNVVAKLVHPRQRRRGDDDRRAPGAGLARRAALPDVLLHLRRDRLVPGRARALGARSRRPSIAPPACTAATATASRPSAGSDRPPRDGR